MTGDPIFLPPSGKSCMGLNMALAQAAGTCAPVILPQQEINPESVQIVSAAGTCDKELYDRFVNGGTADPPYRGGMAMCTDTQNTMTISLPYQDVRLPQISKKPLAMPTNQGMKNLPKDRKAKRRARNKMAKASRKRQ